MRKLVESLLALARGDEGAPLDPKPHDLAAPVGETVQAARAAAGGKVAIEYAPPEDHLIASFDQSRIRQAISILLDNAVKYTPEGGRVTVAARRRDDRAEVAVLTRASGYRQSSYCSSSSGFIGWMRLASAAARGWGSR